MKTCPRCKCIMDERFPGALSRRDNKTEICSECGTLEAMEDYVNSRKKIIKITKQNLEVKMQNKQLRVWWIPQLPMEPYYKLVKSLEEAKLLIDVLAEYDKFQFENNVKPDYSNAGGLQVWDEGLEEDEKGEKWTDWYDDETGMDFDEYCEENKIR